MACRLGSIVLSVALLGTLLAGCASTAPPGAVDQNDPYESFNRQVFDLNEKLDRNVALPTAKFYVRAVPEPLRDGVHNGLTNLSEPVTLANDLLQANGLHAVQTLGRVVVNSTIGLAGLIDVATPMGIPAHDEDFGETLAIYGVGEGPYLVLPLLGPSNPRDAVGHVVDIAFDPLTYIGMREKGWWTGGRNFLGIVDERAQNINTLDEVQRSSLDLYATLRSLYRQHRAAEIRGDKPDLQNLPNI
jgi:phospholipid-binding lipoprotein MlaA